MEQREEGTWHNAFQREPDVLRVLRFMAAGPTLNERKELRCGKCNRYRSQAIEV